MELKANLMDEDQLYRSMARIAHEIIEKNNGVQDICLVMLVSLLSIMQTGESCMGNPCVLIMLISSRYQWISLHAYAVVKK